MKRSTGVVVLFILCGVHLCAQHPGRGPRAAVVSDFLIDPSKPYVYLELDHIGPSHIHPEIVVLIFGAGTAKTKTAQVAQSPERKPDKDIYLRLRNNCRIPIVVFTSRILREQGYQPVGIHPDSLSWVMDKVELNSFGNGYGNWGGEVALSNLEVLRPAPLLLSAPDEILSPELRKTKALLQAEEEKHEQDEIAQKAAETARKKALEEAETKELYELLTRDLSQFSEKTTIPPGMEIYFSIPINHVNKKWHFAIPFQFDMNSSGPMRQPYGYAAFDWFDLTETYR